MFLEKSISNQCRSNRFLDPGLPLSKRKASKKEDSKVVKKKPKEIVELIDEMEKVAHEMIRTDHKLCLKRIKKKRRFLGKDDFLEKVAELEKGKMSANVLKNIVFQDDKKGHGVILTIEQSLVDKSRLLLKIFYRAA